MDVYALPCSLPKKAWTADTDESAQIERSLENKRPSAILQQRACEILRGGPEKWRATVPRLVELGERRSARHRFHDGR